MMGLITAYLLHNSDVTLFANFIGAYQYFSVESGEANSHDLNHENLIRALECWMACLKGPVPKILQLLSLIADGADQIFLIFFSLWNISRLSSAYPDIKQISNSSILFFSFIFKRAEWYLLLNLMEQCTNIKHYLYFKQTIKIQDCINTICFSGNSLELNDEWEKKIANLLWNIDLLCFF